MGVAAGKRAEGHYAPAIVLLAGPALPGNPRESASDSVHRPARGSHADAGKEIPEPFFHPDTVPEMSGKFVTRLPKSVHAKLAERARAEGVSLNTLVLALVAEGLGRRAA